MVELHFVTQKELLESVLEHNRKMCFKAEKTIAKSNGQISKALFKKPVDKLKKVR